jgi:hypothetical protein
MDYSDVPILYFNLIAFILLGLVCLALLFSYYLYNFIYSVEGTIEESIEHKTTFLTWLLKEFSTIFFNEPLPKEEGGELGGMEGLAGMLPGGMAGMASKLLAKK